MAPRTPDQRGIPAPKEYWLPLQARLKELGVLDEVGAPRKNGPRLNVEQKINRPGNAPGSGASQTVSGTLASIEMASYGNSGTEGHIVLSDGGKTSSIPFSEIESVRKA